MRVRFSRFVLFIAAAAVAAACGGNSYPTTPSNNNTGGSTGGTNATTVTIPSSDGYGASSFSPGSLTIPVGGTVNWVNRDSVAHTSTAENGAWNATINAGSEFSRTFATAGTFNYKCTIHAGMSGTITVQ